MTKQLSFFGTLISAAFVVSLSSLDAMAQSSVDRGGKPLSQRAVYALYAGKTWFWNDGGGYFRRDGRFLAMSGKSRRLSRVAGGWGAYRNGKVCFSGTWKSSKGDGFDSTCFLHKRVGRKIYQKRYPYGRWYVFRSAPTRKSDEYRKLARGNYANWYLKRQRRIARSKKVRRSRATRQRRANRGFVRHGELNRVAPDADTGIKYALLN
jgi:hypothetical protein